MRRRRASHPLSWQIALIRGWEGWPDYLEAIGLTVAMVGIMVGLAVIVTVTGTQP